ncbi:MAG TPA: sensor domain-containing diguanylate cyclase [Gaiellaceae bacterium]|nr:sensor domain-containing diguanylate cyclase [Gaiellaceae bacterium]
MSHASTAAISALGVLLLALVGVLWFRLHQSSGRVAEVEHRLDGLAAELGGAVERAEEEARRSRLLGEIGASIDLDEVLQRALDLAAALSGVDAALVRVDGPDAPTAIAALGITDEEAVRQSSAIPPGRRDLRAVELAYRYSGADQEADNGSRIQAGIAVPLSDDGAQLGTLIALSRVHGHRFEDRELLRLEEIAHRTAPAIENARRFREARQLADLDALTELHNRRYFHETLAREAVRAHRYARKLALIVFDLDDFKEVNDRIGHLAGDAVLAEASARMRAVVRTADVPCRVGGDEFAVIMPESTLDDAEQLFNRIQTVMSTRALGQAGRLHLSAGLAELRPEDDAVTLFERADRALYSAKQAGKGRSAAAAS